jgi:polyisoprenoid-binding protein YceI
MKLIFSIILLIGLFYQTNAQVIDADKSKVIFEVTSLKINTVDGSFKGMHGKVDFDSSAVEKSTFDVCIDASTVKTGIGSRDNHLRGTPFFNVKEYPKICIKVDSIEKLKDNYVAVSELTMLGVTLPVRIPFSYKDNTLQGSFRIDRLDFGLGKGMGTFTISNEVEITIICVLK